MTDTASNNNIYSVRSFESHKKLQTFRLYHNFRQKIGFHIFIQK